MLKIVRELAVDNPWVLKIIMGVIALTFVITMGWWGIKAPQQNVLASVNGHDVNAQDYRKAYNRAVAYYREVYKEKFDAEMLEKLKVRDKVLDDLISRELWLDEAERFGVRVSDEELRDGIMKMKEFHNNGKFDRSSYERLLKLNRVTVGEFEEARRKELMIDKVKRVVKDSVAVADDEVNEAFPLNLAGGKDAGAGSKLSSAERPAEEMQKLKKFLQFQKQEKAVMAYATAMRAKAKVNINKELL
ncbi:MAG TPA: SurA N-terminal domain-containing protein [Nitrospirota bacterium]|nr:SurA N-terminal domain-containing protein [Nitrospirota bacterium]